MTALPSEVDWSLLSLRSREIVLHISLRQASGLSLDEVVAALNDSRPEIRHVDLRPLVTKGWVQTKLRDVRRGISEVRAATY